MMRELNSNENHYQRGNSKHLSARHRQLFRSHRYSQQNEENQVMKTRFIR